MTTRGGGGSWGIQYRVLDETPDARRQTPAGARSPARKRGIRSRSAFVGQASGQRGEHPLHLFQFRDHRTYGFAGRHIQENSNEKVGFQLGGRAKSDVHKPTELSAPVSATTLRNIGRYGNRCTATLGHQAEPLRRGKQAGDLVHAVDDDATSLPYLQLLKVLHTPLLQVMIGKGNTHTHRRRTGRFGVWRLASSVSSPSEASNRYAAFVSGSHPDRTTGFAP